MKILVVNEKFSHPNAVEREPLQMTAYATRATLLRCACLSNRSQGLEERSDVRSW